MSTDTTPDGGGPDAPQPAPDIITAFLDALVPPEGAEITDEAGKSHKLPSRISARKQIAVGRAINGIVASAREAGASESMGEFVSRLVDACLADDKLLDSLDQAFAVALPQVLEAAAGDLSDGPPLSATDLFPLEEMVGALVPFLARPIRDALRKTGMDKALFAA